MGLLQPDVNKIEIMVFKYFRLLSYSLLAKQKSLIYRMRSIKYYTKVKTLNSLMERFNLKFKF